MKIAILGCGATGSAFAAYLMKGGANDIWMIDLNRVHMDAVRENGLTFTDHNGTVTLKGFHTAYTADQVGVCDILIILVKSIHTRSAMENSAACIDENTVVLSLQNGIGNDLDLSEYLPEENIALGCGRIGTILTAPGACTAKPSLGITNMFVGPLHENERTERACRYIVDCFARGGLNPEYHSDIRPSIWKKAAANSGFNTVTAVTGLTMKTVFEDENGLGLVKSILKEASDVAAALKIADDLYTDLVNEIPATIASYGDYYPSLAQDYLIYKRPTEVNTLSGAISRYGRIAGVPTPVCDVLSQVVRTVQANYQRRYKDNL